MKNAPVAPRKETNKLFQAPKEPTRIYLTDRSSSDLDDRCGMAFWWNKLEGERGVVSKKESFYYAIGRESHEDLAAISDLADISPEAIDRLIREITDPITDEDRVVIPQMEVLYRRLGWLAAWALFMEPKVRMNYENVSTEAEIILDRDPLHVALTPDRVLRDRKQAHLVNWEYKTTLSAGAKWQQHWRFAIQLHIAAKAIEEELGEPLAYSQIVGLMKGEFREGRLAHPYVWAYRNRSSGEWTHEYSKARASAWERAPVWEFDGGVTEWVRRLGSEIGVAQFPLSAPVFLDIRMLDSWLVRRLAREREIAGVREDCRTDWGKRVIHFEPRTAQCRPAFGDPCQYLACCWNATVGNDPIGSGEFVPRVPHHEIELTYRSDAASLGYCSDG